MQFLYDFFPILLFFITYKLWNIYAATGVAIIAVGIQVFLFWIKHHSFEKMQLATLLTLIILGSATLILHNPIFIKWKPTIVEWIFAFIFLGSQFIGKKSIIQRCMEKKITLPHVIWNRLNMSWGIFFIIMGILNLYVIYHYSTNAWVNFKLFGLLGLTLLFVVLQSFYLSKHLDDREQKTEDSI